MTKIGRRRALLFIFTGHGGKMESKKGEEKYTWSSLLLRKYGFPQKLVKSAHSVRLSPLGMCNYVERVSENNRSV